MIHSLNGRDECALVNEHFFPCLLHEHEMNDSMTVHIISGVATVEILCEHINPYHPYPIRYPLSVLGICNEIMEMNTCRRDRLRPRPSSSL